jgi:CHASE3 domain sensor protein
MHLHRAMLGLAILILLLMSGLAYRDWRQYTAARATGLRLLDIQNTVEALQSSLLDAETGQRGFLLTGDERYLEPYHRALGVAPAEAARLDQLLKSANGEESPDLPRLKMLVAGKVAELSQTVDLRKREGIGPATEVVRSDRGKKEMDEIRGICASIRQQVATERLAIQAQAWAATRGSLVVTTVGSLILTILIVTGYLIIGNRTRDREEALSGMRSLYELGTRVMRQSDVRSLLGELLETAMTITAADMGNIQLLDSQGALRIEAHHGFGSEFLEFFNTVQDGEAASCAAALGSHEQVVIPDVQKSPIFQGAPALDVLLRAGVRAVQSTPLIAQRESRWDALDALPAAA